MGHCSRCFLYSSKWPKWHKILAAMMLAVSGNQITNKIKKKKKRLSNVVGRVMPLQRGPDPNSRKLWMCCLTQQEIWQQWISYHLSLLNLLAHPGPSSPACSDYFHLPWRGLQPQDKIRQRCNWQARVQLTGLVCPQPGQSLHLKAPPGASSASYLASFPGVQAPHFHLAGSPGILSMASPSLIPPPTRASWPRVRLHFARPSWRCWPLSGCRLAPGRTSLRPPSHPGLWHAQFQLSKLPFGYLPFQLCPLWKGASVSPAQLKFRVTLLSTKGQSSAKTVSLTSLPAQMTCFLRLHCYQSRLVPLVA